MQPCRCVSGDDEQILPYIDLARSPFASTQHATQFSMKHVLSQIVQVFSLGIVTILVSWIGSPLVNGMSYHTTEILSRMDAIQAHLSLQNVTTCARNLHSARSLNGLTTFDFASLNAGGEHFPTLTSRGSFPDRALTSSLDEGQCWLLPGVIGHLGIHLPNPVTVMHFSVDHAVLPAVTHQRDAPRSMILWGWIEGDQNFAIFNSSLYLRGLSHSRPSVPDVTETLQKSNPRGVIVELAHVEYNPFDGDGHRQTFAVHSDVSAAGLDFGIVVLEIKGNWGADTTCLYGIHIHGHRVIVDHAYIL